MQRVTKSRTGAAASCGLSSISSEFSKKPTAVRTGNEWRTKVAGLQPVLVAKGQNGLGRILPRGDRAVSDLDRSKSRNISNFLAGHALDGNSARNSGGMGP